MLKMKNTIILLGFFCTTMLVCKSQSSRIDTLQYLINIEKSKQNYVGKPFAVLINSLEIKPLSAFSVFASNDKNSLVETAFFFENTIDRVKAGSIRMIIIWQEKSKNIQEAWKLEKKGTNGLTNEQIQFYHGKKIKDIVISRKQ